MEFLVPTLIAVILSAAVFGGAFVFIKKKMGGSSTGSRTGLIAEITALTNELDGLKRFERSYAGSGQLTGLKERIERLDIELTGESETLRGVEAKLQEAQKVVEGKESQQQEIKSVKLKDEIMLQDLLSRYDDISGESIALEQKLAQSMKNLDSMLSELTLTQDQRALLTDLSNGLTAAGERLRELLTEYQTVKDRLDMLTQQHADLEQEYTKLVEQQLGE